MLFFPPVRFLSYAVFAAGILFSVAAVGSGAYFLNFRIHSLVTTGTIISIDVKQDGAEYHYCPHFRFEASDHKTYTVPCRIWQGAPAFSVGAVVPIRYKQSDPSDAWLESRVGEIPGVTAIAGAFGLCFGFALLWYARKRETARTPR
jgi:hypothetical protein